MKKIFALAIVGLLSFYCSSSSGSDDEEIITEEPNPCDSETVSLNLVGIVYNVNEMEVRIKLPNGDIYSESLGQSFIQAPYNYVEGDSVFIEVRNPATYQIDLSINSQNGTVLASKTCDGPSNGYCKLGYKIPCN